MVDPIRPTDETARGLAKTLLRTARSGALATTERGAGRSGFPAASLVSVATTFDGAPLILVSRLSGHTGNVLADGRCSLLVGQAGRGDPLAHPRMTVFATAVVQEGDAKTEARRRFLAHNPKSELYIDFPDFLLLRLEPSGASLNGGFGKAYELAAADLLTDVAGAEELAAAEEGAVAHMNADHGEALNLYATKLCGEEPGGACWLAAGLDPEGMDLVSGDRVTRLAFPHRITAARGLRTILKALADEARAA